MTIPPPARRRAGFGLKADTPDVRDLLLGEIAPTAPAADLRPVMPPVYNQGNLGSCVGNGVAACMEHLWLAAEADFMPSRLFIYYNARTLEGDASWDSGAQLRDGMTAAAQWGACHEALWPYDLTKFADQPAPESYADAAKHRAIVYYRVQRDLAQLSGCLTAGFPVAFGTTVYESFESPQVAATGMVPLPGLGEKVIGVHCMVLVGFDTATTMFLVRNSWGPAWGIGGHCWLPFQFVLNRNLTADFWTIRQST